LNLNLEDFAVGPQDRKQKNPSKEIFSKSPKVLNVYTKTTHLHVQVPLKGRLDAALLSIYLRHLSFATENDTAYHDSS
jgi:hypothetical protein